MDTKNKGINNTGSTIEAAIACLYNTATGEITVATAGSSSQNYGGLPCFTVEKALTGMSAEIEFVGSGKEIYGTASAAIADGAMLKPTTGGKLVICSSGDNSWCIAAGNPSADGAQFKIRLVPTQAA